jgi:hydroxyacylglutathione hydrolase
MLTIQKWSINPFSENTYGVSDGDGNALIIDPGMYNAQEAEEVFLWLEKNGEKSQSIYLTHAHLDHVFGCDYLFQKLALVPKCHPLDEPTLSMAARAAQMYQLNFTTPPKVQFTLNEGDEIYLGEHKAKVIFVPGHAPGHTAFYFEEERKLFSGDVLFQGSVGRTDLPGGSEDVLRQSIEKLYNTLPNDTMVYSGHGDETTIGNEKKSNPFVNEFGSGLFQGKSKG